MAGKAGPSSLKHTRLPGISSSTRQHASVVADTDTKPPDSAYEAAEIKKIYEHFHALGMPQEITLEVFERLFSSCSGERGVKLKDALKLLSERLVGRQEVWRVRGIIARAREEHAASKEARPSSKLKAPAAVAPLRNALGDVSDPRTLLEDPMKAALARRESAYRGLASVKKEHEKVKNDMLELDSQKRVLEKSLEDKRRISLLLNVLEKRETVRLTRLGAEEGMGKVIEDLRKQTNLSVKKFLEVISNPASFEISLSVSSQEAAQRVALERRKKEAFKYKHTTAALAKLHAHHIRSSRGDGDSTLAMHDVERRLERALGKLWPSNDPKDLENMKTQIMEIARRRTEKKMRLQPGGHKVAKMDLDRTQRKIEEKEKQAQMQINRAVALGWLCEEYIDLISTFRSQTAKDLSDVLEGERNRLHGYVEILLAEILPQSQSTSKSATKPELRAKDFEQEVRAIMRSSRVAVSEDVKVLAEKVVNSEDMMRKIKPIAVKSLQDEDDAYFDFEEILKASAERNRKLLERKGKKAEYGFEVAKEIRSLLDGVRKLK